MNLLQQLELANRPWVVLPDPPKKRRGNGSPNNKVANEAKHRQAVARYKKACREEWTRTVDIESRMGMGRGTILFVLGKWEKLGIVERRPFNNEPYNRKKGFEWRFK